ncbi:hypothetical protein LCGC14_1873130, partial [marine sediment metagenome]
MTDLQTMSQTKTLDVPKHPPDQPEDQRAIHIPTFLSRILPYYGQPQWLQAQHWRQFVKNQNVAIVARDTLIANMLNMEYDIVSRNPDDAGLTKIKNAVDYYKEVFENFDGDFDIHLDLILQDMLTLPFGGASEEGRWDDDPEGPIIWSEHIDAATLFPTGNPTHPVAQRVPDVPGVQVVFPEHAINRMYMTPRPDIRLKGWGMAPPQKIYLAIDMLFKGDIYYWKLLLDTPEAGLLDLMNMKETHAVPWIEAFREMFQGIDGFKLPVLYGHDKAAQWIPFNRPPLEMMYDTVYRRYAQLVCAGYGIRLSDIGLEEEGTKALSGVVRGERQTKRTGRAVLKSKTTNYFQRKLPEELKFRWKEKDEEGAVAKGRGMVSVGQGIKIAIDSGLLSKEEGRAELVASGLLDIEVDPKEMPEPPPVPAALPFGQQPPQLGANGGPVPATQGGRGTTAPPVTTMSEKSEGQDPKTNPPIKDQRSVIDRMNDIIRPSLEGIRHRAEDPRLRRLIKAATREMFGEFELIAKRLDDDQIKEIWLPEMQAATFDQASEIESPLIRRDIEAAKAVLETHLENDLWWSMASTLDKQAILELFVEAYEHGLEEAAIEIIRSLYEEGLRASPFIASEISFDLVNPGTLEILERAAAELVTRVDQGTKYFLKRMVVAGVRQGLSSPKIAAAIRDGAAAENILRREDYLDDVIGIIKNGLIDMTEYRANSIVNTEIARAENQ